MEIFIAVAVGGSVGLGWLVITPNDKKWRNVMDIEE